MVGIERYIIDIKKATLLLRVVENLIELNTVLENYPELDFLIVNFNELSQLASEVLNDVAQEQTK